MSVFLHRVGLLRPLAAAPSGYSFTMTAGQAFGFVNGYSTGGDLGAFGSIDQEPISGQTLAALFELGGGDGSINFDGDIVSIVSGLTVWVDSVEYPFDSDWVFADGFTAGEWTGSGPAFVNTNMYFVEIK